MTAMYHWHESSSSVLKLRLAIVILAFFTVLNISLPLFMPIPPIMYKGSGLNQKDYITPMDGNQRAWNLTLKQVALTVEDSVNFQLDTVEGTEQWSAIQPPDHGYITLNEGTGKRRYRLAMFHALNCLDIVRQNLLERRVDRITPASPDAHFCLDYLRQTIQCRSDTQLEQVRSEYGGKSVQPFVTHNNCRDWSKVYAELERFASEGIRT